MQKTAAASEAEPASKLTSSQKASDSSVALAIHDLTVAYDKKPVLWDIHLNIPKGRLAGIVGPNGAGKSTLIKAALGLVPSVSGSVTVFGKPYKHNKRRVGYVPQRESVDWDFPVSALDVTLMGRYGRIGWFRRPGRKDHEAAMEALAQVGMADFAKRQISELSGGQQQRVFLARALVQEADLYFMDEPFSGVDAATEKAIVKLLQELNNQGRTVLVVHHDLQTIREYFDYVVMLNLRLVAAGDTKDVFNEVNLNKTYGGRLTALAEAAAAMARGR